MMQSDLCPRLPLVLAGVEIGRFSWSEAMNAVDAVQARQPLRLTWVYANCINLARQDAAYRDALRRAEFTLNDGAGIEIAGRLKKRPVVGNLCGTDWIPAYFDRLATRGESRRLFVLGTRDPVLQSFVDVARVRWPQLHVVGTHHGFSDDDAVPLAAIAAARPDVLLVAMGVPRQELFLDRHWAQLVAAGVRLGIAGGAVVDYVAGAVPRAPQWMRRWRLEWCYRLAIEPQRLWRRYLVGNATFLWHVLRES